MKNKKKLIAIILIILAISIFSITSLSLYISNRDKDKNKKNGITEVENDMVNIDKYYLERNDSKIRASRMYGNYEFYDVTFSGSNGAYWVSGNVKNKSDKDIDYITFIIQYLDQYGNVAFEENGIAGFDENKVSIIHLETTKVIPLYYDYKIINIKEKYN